MYARVRDTNVRVHSRASPGDEREVNATDMRAGKSDALSDEIRIYVAAASTATETA